MSAHSSDHHDEPAVEPATPAPLAAEAGPPVGGESVAADAGTAAGSEAEAPIEAEDDDGPVELADPFEGDENAKPVEEAVDDDSATPAAAMDWFILKVQSNREDSVREALQRRIMMQGMEKLFGEVIVPKEQVTEFKGGKKRVVSRKLYPGYILVQMVLNDESWFLVRETGGIGPARPAGRARCSPRTWPNSSTRKRRSRPRLPA